MAISHGELLAGAQALVKSTGGQEASIVVSSDDYYGFASPDRKQRLRAYLGVTPLHAVGHIA